MARVTKVDQDASHDIAVIAVRVLDDAYITWIAAEIDSDHALHAWFETVPRDRGAAYVAYRASVDREEAAARDLERLHALTRPCQEHLAFTQ